jgi:hypothetical protein
VKHWNNEPFHNEIPARMNFISSPSVISFDVKSPFNNKTLAIKYNIFDLFRFVKWLHMVCVFYQEIDTTPEPGGSFHNLQRSELDSPSL